MPCCESCDGCDGATAAYERMAQEMIALQQPRLIRASTPRLILREGMTLGFIGPLLSLVSAVNTVRALGAFGSCPEAVTAEQRTYSQPWTGSYPNYVELSDWYDKAAEELARAAQTPGMLQAPLTALQKRFDDLPNRLSAMTSPTHNGNEAREIAQRALCLFHDATQGTTTELPPLPPPPPPDKPSGWFECLPTDPRPNEPFPKCKIPTVELPWWVFAVGAGAVFLLLSNREREDENRRQRR